MNRHHTNTLADMPTDFDDDRWDTWSAIDDAPRFETVYTLTREQGGAVLETLETTDWLAVMHWFEERFDRAANERAEGDEGRFAEAEFRATGYLTLASGDVLRRREREQVVR